MIIEIALVIGSYLLGSVSWGYILGKYLKGIDIREKDLPGAAGSFRQLGPFIGISVGFLDTVKGIIPMLIAIGLGMGYTVIILSALAVLIGHNWPIFFQFKGGGGLSVILGVLICLMPKELLIAWGLAIVSGFMYKHSYLYSSLKLNPNPVGAAFGLISLPLLAWYFGRPQQLILLTVLLFLVVIIRAAQLFLVKRLKKLRKGNK